MVSQQQSHGGAVAKVVEADGREVGGLEETFEVLLGDVGSV